MSKDSDFPYMLIHAPIPPFVPCTFIIQNQINPKAALPSYFREQIQGKLDPTQRTCTAEENHLRNMKKSI
jgi:hypothetical protein